MPFLVRVTCHLNLSEESQDLAIKAVNQQFG